MSGSDEFKLVSTSLIFWRTPIRDFTDDDIENMASSMMIHGQIQPIVVKPPNVEGLHEGVCGRLRYEGAKHAHRPEVLARVHNFEDEAEVLEWQIVENLHRKDLTAIQRGEAYTQLYDLRRKELGGVKDKSIVAGIAESIERQTGEKKAEDIIGRYIQIAKELPEKIKKKIGFKSDFGLAHARQLLRLKDKPKMQLELAEKFVRKPMTVQSLKQEVNKILKPPPPRVSLPEFLKKVNPIFYEFSVWEVPDERPEGGIVDYKGNCSPYVCAGCLYNYAREGDIVMDAMAGSGTFLDVAKEIKTSEGKQSFREIICWDLNPVRSDITQGDAEKIDRSVDFIFVHFPYWNSVNYVEEAEKHGAKNIDERNELSQMPFDKFEAKSKAILHKLHNALQTGRNLCLMIGPKRDGGELLDLPWLFMKWACEDEDGPKFALEDKIIVMTYNPRKISFKAEGKRRLAIGRGRKNNHLNINYDEVLVFKK